jgi:hypothetical protein
MEGPMKRIALFSALILMAAVARAAEPKEEVLAAAKKLGDAANYSWKSTTVATGGFGSGSVDGRADKDGTVLVSMTGRNNSMTEGVMKGEKGALTNQDGDWQSLAELDGAEGFARFGAFRLRNAAKAPAVHVPELVKIAKELKKDGDVISGDLTPDGVKELLSFRRPGANADGPTITVANPSGKVKFWVKDGIVSKYEYNLKGSVTFGDNTNETDRTTTVEVNKVGETKVNVPEAAKKKLS